MKLCTSTQTHLHDMMAWFPDQESCAIWGGPSFRFPFAEQTFLEDIAWGKLASYSLLDDEGALLGFGQYYLREKRCHLGRLAISPAQRGLGLGRVLIAGLTEIGCADLGVTECSLFVLERNQLALQCYQRAGFAPALYPGGEIGLDACLYMVKAQ